MGAGAFTATSFAMYNAANSKAYDADSGRVSGQVYTARDLDPSLNPKNVIRECANSEEHPNTIPVILALDVTGSMGPACQETAEALGIIMKNLYENFKDIEFCIMGIGDLAYDSAPIQMSQFESDIRIAEALDKVYMEHGGGGNGFESYTAAWYMGLRHTKLDCYDKQGRKGIIITMGDEPMNPYLPAHRLSLITGDSIEGDSVETNQLYQQAIEKFDIFHIAISGRSSYSAYAVSIKNSFGKLLGNRLKVSSVDELANTICDCIQESVNGTQGVTAEQVNGSTGFDQGIRW